MELYTCHLLAEEQSIASKRKDKNIVSREMGCDPRCLFNYMAWGSCDEMRRRRV